MLVRSLTQNNPPIMLQEKKPGPSVSLHPDEQIKYARVSNSQVSSEQKLLSWQSNKGLHKVKHHPFPRGLAAYGTPSSSTPYIALGSQGMGQKPRELLRQIPGHQQAIVTGSRIS